MTREILFRGEDKNNIWREGSLVKEIDDFKIYCIEPYGEDDGTDYWLAQYEVNPETVGQYTGLKDKNGVKIFEGDILNWWWGVNMSGTITVKFNDGIFGFDYNGKVRSLSTIRTNDDETITVIGNIHDNPELLEVRDEL